MKEESLFNESTIEKIIKIRKIFQKIIVGFVIGLFVLLAVFIVVGVDNIKVINKIFSLLTVWTIGILIAMSNFKCIEKKQRMAQIFSIVSLATCAVWVAIASVNALANNEWINTPLAKVLNIISDTMLCGLFGAWIATIKENGGPIKPLKITALSCLVFFWVYAILVILVNAESLNPTFTALAGLAAMAFMVTWAMAASISKRNNKEKLNKIADTGAQNLNTEDMQKQIREMVEKEVQERLKAEQAAKESPKE